jgi:hypothetical protein
VSTPAPPPPPASFWSRATGRVAIGPLTSNRADPAEATQLHFRIASLSRLPAFVLLIRRRSVQDVATVDAPADGLHFILRGVTVTGKSYEPPSRFHPRGVCGVSVRFAGRAGYGLAGPSASTASDVRR